MGEAEIASAAEEESDVDTSVVEDTAEDISTTENKTSAEECKDTITEGDPEEGSIVEAEDTGDAEDIVNMVEDVTAKYIDVPADSDTSMDLADVVAVEQEASKEASRFECSFGCGKSYSAKCNLANHEIKVHNRPKLRIRKSQKPTASLKEQEETESKVQTDEELTAGGENLGNNETWGVDAEEAISVAEELEESNASSFFNDSSLGDYDFEEKELEVDGNTAVDAPTLSKEDEVEEGVHLNGKDEETSSQGEEEEEEKEGGPSKGAILAKLRKAGAMNVLPDFPLPKEDKKREVEEEEVVQDGSSTEKTSATLDLKSSEYFTKYPKAIANPQERSLKLFNDDAEGLPEGWKVRLLKDPRDEGRTVRHYLSPDMRVLKTGQGVVEYLRLEGSLPTDQILNIAKNVLQLSDKKINALYL